MINFFLYVIQCEDGYLYVGIANSLNKRINQHKAGLCRNTKNRGRIRLVYSEVFSSRLEAARREKEIKGWRREKKEKLIQSIQNLVYSEQSEEPA